MHTKGIFIVLEGADGSGKTTQFNLLTERLKAVGHEVETFVFPRYAEESSYFVRKYLDGDFGPASQVSPYTASLFYALDRYEAAKDVRKALGQGKIVLASRYVGSNMAHQGGKFSDPVEQRGFFVWEDNLEFQMLNIPRPDLNLYLRVPAETAFKLIKERARATKNEGKNVEHENDLNHLKNTVATYDLLCQLFPTLVYFCACN
jgi:dTMP kinase